MEMEETELVQFANKYSELSKISKKIVSYLVENGYCFKGSIYAFGKQFYPETTSREYLGYYSNFRVYGIVQLSKIGILEKTEEGFSLNKQWKEKLVEKNDIQTS